MAENISPKAKRNYISILINVLRKTQTIVIWVPVLTLILGFSLSGYVYTYFKHRTFETERAESYRQARERISQLDLQLSNSILRIQNYEEAVGTSPLHYRKKEKAYLQQALQYTVFQHLTIVRNDTVVPLKNRSQNQPGKLDLKMVFRVDVSKEATSSVDTRLEKLNSARLARAIGEMNIRSTFIERVLHNVNGTPCLSVIMRSKINRDAFFIFTTPFLTLFDKVALDPKESIVISSPESDLGWVITNINRHKKIASYNLDEDEDDAPLVSRGFYHLDFNEGLPQSGLSLGMRFNFSYRGPGTLSPANIGGGMGILITMIVSFLFYVLITQNRRANRMLFNKTAALERTAHDLQEALNTKTQFLGKISHEIRTPLNLILGMIDLCEEHDSEHKMDTYLGSMKSSGEHLLSMIDDLIDLAKTESSELNFHGKKTNVVQFLGDTLKLVGQECQKKSLKLYCFLSPDLPAGIMCDPNRLRQILLNLLRNASKYTHEGYILFRAIVLKNQNPEKIKIRFEIQDTGVGIPSDKLGKVFDAFFQIESSSMFSEGGVGLGLSIVKDLVKKMNGDVHVKSIPNEGSTFQVDLEFDISEKQTWLETYRSPGDLKENLIVVSSDIYFTRCFEPLSRHPDIKLAIWTPEELPLFIRNTPDVERSWFVLDATSQHVSFDRISSNFGHRKVMVCGNGKSGIPGDAPWVLGSLSEFPPLPYEMLPPMGLSTRGREKRDFKKSVNTQTRPSEGVGKGPAVSLLVADDDSGNIVLYKAYFAATNWMVQYVGNGLEAWEAFMKEKPDIVVLDLRMPVMDGFQTIEKIRAYENKNGTSVTPIILITADLLDYTTNRAKSFENVTLLTKPVRKTQILECIRELAQQSTASDSKEAPTI